jgi:hypothetical protein
MDVTLVIAIIGCVIGVLSFFFNRKDKGEKDNENTGYKMGVIEEKLKNISEQIKTLTEKFDIYDREIDKKIDDKIEKSMQYHIKAYHNKE